MTESKEKILQGKNFSTSRFLFKMLFQTVWLDFEQKLLTLSYFYYFGHFGQKMTESPGKI